MDGVVDGAVCRIISIGLTVARVGRAAQRGKVESKVDPTAIGLVSGSCRRASQIGLSRAKRARL